MIYLEFDTESCDDLFSIEGDISRVKNEHRIEFYRKISGCKVKRHDSVRKEEWRIPDTCERTSWDPCLKQNSHFRRLIRIIFQRENLSWNHFTEKHVRLKERATNWNNFSRRPQKATFFHWENTLQKWSANTQWQTPFAELNRETDRGNWIKIKVH